jgi:hypothetical protein
VPMRRSYFLGARKERLKSRSFVNIVILRITGKPGKIFVKLTQNTKFIVTYYCFITVVVILNLKILLLPNIIIDKE